jgi:hypothetical protein
VSPTAQSLAWRLAAAAVAAIALIAALEVWLRARDARAAPALAAPGTRAVPAPSASRFASIGAADLGVDAGEVCLCAAPSHVPAAAQPVLQVLADGSVVLKRPAPLPSSPRRATVATAALLLPTGALADLTPRQRAAVLDQLGALFAARPVAAGRVRLCGVAGDAKAVRRLLEWVR